MVDEYLLWQLLQRQKTTPAGLALWLTWQMDLSAKDIVALTWDQVDLERGELHLGGRTLPLTQALCRQLRQVRQERGYLLRSPAGKPLGLSTLSRLARRTLEEGGLSGVTLRSLRRGLREDQEADLLRLAEKNRFVTCADAQALWDLGAEAAAGRLGRLAERGKLRRLGNRYYAALPSPGERLSLIRGYLEEAGFAYRQDIARLLGMEARQCSAELRALVEQGELRLEGRKYTLPGAGKK